MKLTLASLILLAPAGMDLGGGGAAAAAAAPVNARVDATRVERSFIGSGTSSGYIDQLVRFILYLYDKKDTLGDYLTDQYRTQMDMFNQNDTIAYQGRRNRRQKNQRPELRAYIKRRIPSWPTQPLAKFFQVLFNDQSSAYSKLVYWRLE